MSHYDDDNWSDFDAWPADPTFRADIKRAAVMLAVGFLAGVCIVSILIDLGVV